MFLQKCFKHILIEISNKLFSSFLLSAPASLCLQLFGAQIGKNARIYTPLLLHNTKYKNLSIGDNCHIGRDVLFDLADEICIGNNVTISMRCTLITHLDFGNTPLKTYGYQNDRGKVCIRDGVYIGAGSTILHGVEIGQNSLVGAGALVNTHIPPYSLVVGIPGKIVKHLEHEFTPPAARLPHSAD